jgi:hypothetical protein
MLLGKYNYSGKFKDDDKDHDDPEFKEYQEVEYMKFKDRQERMYWAKMDERDRLRWERENGGSGSGSGLVLTVWWLMRRGWAVDLMSGAIRDMELGSYWDEVPEEDRMME